MTELTYRFCEDWFIFAEDEFGNVYFESTEMWPEWLDVARAHYPDLSEMEAYEAFEESKCDDSVERYMLPVAMRCWDSLSWTPFSMEDMTEWRAYLHERLVKILAHRRSQQVVAR
jgi:hypothetical protein